MGRIPSRLAQTNARRAPRLSHRRSRKAAAGRPVRPPSRAALAQDRWYPGLHRPRLRQRGLRSHLERARRGSRAAQDRGAGDDRGRISAMTRLAVRRSDRQQSSNIDMFRVAAAHIRHSREEPDQLRRKPRAMIVTIRSRSDFQFRRPFAKRPPIRTSMSCGSPMENHDQHRGIPPPGSGVARETPAHFEGQNAPT